MILNIDYSCVSHIIDEETIFHTHHLKQFWNIMEDLVNVKMSNTVYQTDFKMMQDFISIKMNRCYVKRCLQNVTTFYPGKYSSTQVKKFRL